MLEDIYKEFAELRKISITSKIGRLHLQQGNFSAGYTSTPMIELMHFEKENEIGCIISGDANTYRAELSIGITQGCLPDYLTMLYHDDWDFTHFDVRQRFERVRPSEDAYQVFVEHFKGIRDSDIKSVLNCFSPYE